MLEVYYKDKKTADLDRLKDKKFRAGSWIHLEDPTADELQRLVKELGLDEGTLMDSTDLYEAPRVAKEGDSTFLFTRVPLKQNGEVSTVPVVVIIHPNCIVTISTKELPLWNLFTETRVSFLTTQKTKLLFLIFREINSQYQRFLLDINKKLRKISINLEKIENKDIIQFVRFEQALNDFITALVPTNNAFNLILNGKYFKLYEEDSDLIEDLSLSNAQLIKVCESNLKNIANVRGAYSTIMSNNLNQTIKILTILTIVLAVPTMIASFFGMNVKMPFNDNNSIVFWLIVFIATIMAFFVSVFFKKDRF